MNALILKPDLHADVLQMADRAQQVHRIASETADRLDEHNVDAPSVAVCDEAVELAALFYSGTGS